MDRKWYVIRTVPRTEFLAVDELTRAGYEIFFPRVRVPRARPGHEYAPLFPGYLFLRCDPQVDGWPSFRGLHSVQGWLSFGGEVPSLPEDAINTLIERSETIGRQGGFIRRFLPGEMVRVLSGNLDSLAEVVEEAKTPRARAKVLLHFMGGLIQAQVPFEDLRPVEQHSGDDSSQQRLSQRRTRGRGRWIQGFGPRAVARA